MLDHARGQKSSFHNFSAQLYCAGAEEQRCPGGAPAGICHWLRPAARTAERNDLRFAPLTPADANRSWDVQSRAYPTDRWDPTRIGSTGFRYFGREAAGRCLRGKRIHFAGDSTTRDTFYEFMAMAGYPMFSESAFGEWPAGAYEPRSPISSGGKDRVGECLGNYDRKKYCLRDERHVSNVSGVETRVSFQFLMQSNSSWEVEQATKLLAGRRLDAAFVQCPIYEWFKPDAYNYSKSKEERARVVDIDELAVGPQHWAGMGMSCAHYIDKVIRPAIAASSGGGVHGSGHDGDSSHGKHSSIFLLGPTPLPKWTRIHGTEEVESRVFKSIHAALGVRCHKHHSGDWAVSTHSGITPIDRYAIVGGRRRDAIHPFFNAQFAIAQLMLNHICPAPTYP